MTKIRHVDFSPDEWLAGTAELSDEDRGVYITVCALIYSRGGPVRYDVVKGHSRSHGNKLQAALDRLEKAGKIVRNGPEIDQKRCENELEKARKRSEKALENGSKGGRPNGLAKPDGFDGGKTNHQPPTTNHQPSEEVRDPEKEESSDKTAQAPSLPVPSDDPPAPIAPTTVPAGYAFYGRVIHLRQEHFDDWRRTFYAIPDLTAWLVTQDKFYDEHLTGQDRGKWFIRCSRAAEKRHQEYLAARKSRETAKNAFGSPAFG